jgi:hypothetical protein
VSERGSIGSGVPDSEWRGLCWAGGGAALLLVVYCLGTLVQLLVLGGLPASATEAFDVLQRNRPIGLLRLDLPTLAALPLYYVLFLGLFAALRRVHFAAALLSTTLVFAGVTLTLATPGALSLLALSDRHAAATREIQRQLEAAAEAILAADIWHGTGATIGGVLVLIGGGVMSALMLRSLQFTRSIAILGMLIHALDLAHVFVGLLLPLAGTVLLAVAGTLYPVWFYLVGRRMFGVAATCCAAFRSASSIASSHNAS